MAEGRENSDDKAVSEIAYLLVKATDKPLSSGEVERLQIVIKNSAAREYYYNILVQRTALRKMPDIDFRKIISKKENLKNSLSK